MWIQKALRKDVNVMMNAKFRKKRLIDKDDFVPMITDVCKALGKYSREAVQLLLGTAAAESSFTYRVQIGGGPARGLFGMEPETALDIFIHYLQFRHSLHWKLTQIWHDITGDMAAFMLPVQEDLESHLRYDDAFAAAMARIKYLRVPQAIPKTVEEQAAYWKVYYNTPAGMGTVEHYLSQWNVCRCEELLKGCGL